MKQKITKNMKISEVVQKYPEVAETLFTSGLHCVGCHLSPFETLEQGLTAHGMDKKKVDELIKKLNDVVKNT